jgi:hypothetical protein
VSAGRRAYEGARKLAQGSPDLGQLEGLLKQANPPIVAGLIDTRLLC